ncbi:tRNA (adenosine(37)-N6)-threonylcarbamoyltransferase complex ATPase subunit type 1 TsaE [Thiosulfativibrio zosterae]|uniref:tRNA threonylcarbamoyladenosine biosynthesis protein TsaE n=1 Tax=Thiosulfativibrio zosterae TaxID=2675053 RepID=A0A6F8PP01_9GAMM|nr:tRNA (adenosine(37)-N6)-threonylcarbamoyltransferase complex ATPase subunit type 1 TsaE [Thiosulfativibrio zosterae]BBP43843.1 tRNA (adenosine(37)-N6)-threonylcarbamoyltransferase complex ATPase subunit type 1 TsaE [Thiosulfativibrio zosterae]
MHFNKVSFYLADESATTRFGQAFAQGCKVLNGFDAGLVIFLEGDLGAGKSYLSRAFIQSYLPNQKVKSPTYTLVESYLTPLGTIVHFDLYRLCDPEELEFLALRDLLSGAYIALIEWPSKGAGQLPEADMVVELTHLENTSQTPGRKLTLTPQSQAGLAVVNYLAQTLGTLIVY